MEDWLRVAAISGARGLDFRSRVLEVVLDEVVGIVQHVGLRDSDQAHVGHIDVHIPET